MYFKNHLKSSIFKELRMGNRAIQKLTYLLALIGLNLISSHVMAAAPPCAGGEASISASCDDLTVNGIPSVTVEDDVTIQSTNIANNLNGSILSFTNNGSMVSNKDFTNALENSGTVTNLINNHIFSGFNSSGGAYGNGISNTSTGTITLLSNIYGSTIEGDRGIHNDGVINTLVNYGTISGVWALVNNDTQSQIGALTNGGIISGYEKGVVNFGSMGSIYNPGTGTISSVIGIYNSGGGISGGISNVGQISGTSVGIQIRASSSIGGGINNSGPLADIHGDFGSGILISNSILDGGINNADGAIIESTYSDAIQLSYTSLDGGIYNTNNSSISGGQGIAISFSSLNGGIHNTDSEILANTGEGSAIYLAGLGGTLNGGINNSGTGKMRATGDEGNAIYINGPTINGGINNAGAISATGLNARGIGVLYATLNGGINNSGSISGTSWGISIDNASFNGGINSAGTISSIAIESSSLSGGINNAGEMGSNYFSNSTLSGGINNAGSINSTYNGIHVFYSSISGGINNSGTISGDNNGINNYYSTIDAITNTGTISASVTGINNSVGGTITTLNNSGTITGDGGYGGIINDSIIGTLINSGTISSSNGTAIFSDWATITNLNNSGTIASYSHAIHTYGAPGTATIDTLTNTGTISSSHGYGINTEWGGIGNIGTLNNAQGVGNAAGALTFNGFLPTHYNIIIDRANYGQLIATTDCGPDDCSSSATNFGISSLSGKIKQLTYSNVMSGVTSSKFTNYQSTGTSWGKYLGVDWQLVVTSSSIWDLNFSSLPVYAADTQSSIAFQSRQLRSAFNTQTVAANFGLNYDCNVFDVKGMCISAGGRYTTIDNPNINNSAAVVTLGYKVNPNIRIGAYLDQNINISNPTGINISNNTPLMGLYALWNKEQSGLGYQVRLANTYQDKDITQTRTVFDTSEAGSGRSSLKSQSYLAELSYAFQYQDRTLVRPYAGLRYTHLKQDGYTEATTDTVTDPLTVAALRDKSATALLGVKINRHLTDKATLTAQLGLEQDLHHKVDHYSATDLNGSDLTAVAFNSNIKRTRPVASIGAFYDVTKTQRASATINYQQTAFQSTGSATAYFNYMIGF